MVKKPDDTGTVSFGYNLATQEIKLTAKIPNLSKHAGNIVSFFRRAFWGSSVRSKAKKDAKNGLPHSKATQMTSKEEDILAKRDGAANRLGASVSRVFTAIKKYINTYTPAEKVSATAERDEINAYVDDQLNKASAELEESRAEYDKAKEIYNRFREERKIERQPTATLRPLDAVAPLFALFVLEVIFNAMLLGSVSEQGFLGGTFFAIMFSAVNVGFALFTGIYLFRYAFWGKGNYKLVAQIATPIAVLFIILINLFIAHYREIAEEALRLSQQPGSELAVLESVSPGDAIANMFSAHVLNLSTLESIFLLIFGLGIAAFAMFYEGAYKMVDRVPDYAEAWRHYRRSTGRRNASFGYMNTVISDTLDKISLLANWQQHMHTFFEKEMKNARDITESIHQQAKKQEESFDSWARKWIREYREINRQQRNKNPEAGNAPGYFDDAVHMETKLPDGESVRNDANASIRLIRDNIKEISELRSWIAERKSDLLNQIEARAPNKQEYHALDEHVVIPELRKAFGLSLREGSRQARFEKANTPKPQRLMMMRSRVPRSGSLPELSSE